MYSLINVHYLKIANIYFRQRGNTIHSTTAFPRRDRLMVFVTQTPKMLSTSLPTSLDDMFCKYIPVLMCALACDSHKQYIFLFSESLEVSSMSRCVFRIGIP